MPKRLWTKEEEERLERMYKDGASCAEMSKEIGRSVTAIISKSGKMKLGDKYMRPNNPHFSPIYHDYDWCYDRYVVKGMSHQEMADELGVKLRVIQKWCQDVHGINNHSFRKLCHLTDIQKQIIISGTLGDGHISTSTNQPIYIESHAEDEKDYLFWKYNILKNLFIKPPRYHEAKIKDFSGKNYLCKPSYRMSSRIVDEFAEIKNMSREERIVALNSLGISAHVLDDGSRSSSNWEVCVAEWSINEVDTYINKLKQYGIIAHKVKDIRYISIDSESSRKLDNIILENVDNSLDVINKKILSKANYLRKVG